LIALIAVVVLLAACDAPDTPGQAGPTAPPTAADAENVAKNFLDDWDSANYTAMYALLSPKSLTIDPVTFANTYSDVQNSLKVNDKGQSYVIHSDQTERQGTTVTVHYDMTFDSAPLGKFTDADRTMHLVLVSGKWKVAWSTMDIFEGMAGGAKLSVDYTRSPRGTIFDRNGKPVAQNDVPNRAIRLLPGKYPTGKKEDCFNFLAQYFPVRAPELDKAYGGYTEAQFGNFGFTIGTMSEDDYQRLKSQIDAACKVATPQQTSRFYYNGTFAAQFVGYLGQATSAFLSTHPDYPKDALVGRGNTGNDTIESAYEEELAGKSGAEMSITTPEGIVVRTIQGRQPTQSQDVTTTLNRDLQVATERALWSAFSYANWAQYSKGAAAVVLDPNTGEILAIASYPTVSPDVFLPTTTFDTQDILKTYDSNNQAAYRNRATQNTYAAGSVFKVVATGAATGSGAFKLTDTYTCTGVWDGTKKGDLLRKDWIYLDKYSPTDNHGTLTLEQGLTASCDTYFWTVGEKLNGIDPTLLSKYANQMGMGVKTGVDGFLQEAAGHIPNPAWKLQQGAGAWGLGDSLNIVIGQGDVQVTPIQVARMIMGVANGGMMYQPMLVTKVGRGTTNSYVATPAPPGTNGLTAANIKGIQDALCAVTSDTKIGTANFVFYNWDFNQVEVCAKTGTAQTGSSFPNGWFTAFTRRPGSAKADLAIAVIVESSREGSETAGPIVRRIIESYYHLPQEPWPNYWTGAYDPMVDPNMSDGVIHIKKK